MKTVAACVDQSEKETGDWRRLHKEELHDLCCSPDIIRVIK
jgi:hypothetical protein